MGLGNGNPKQGDRGSNHNFEHRNLLSLGNIAAFVAGGATEATLQLVLAAINNGSEFEARLVEDAVSVTWLEVRTWNTTTGTWNPVVYYPPNSNTPGAPTLPVTYINNSSVLATIASNTTGISLEATQLLVKGVLDAILLDTANLDVALSTRATEATLASLEAKLNTLGQKASAASAPVVLSTEQETILATIDAVLDAIKLDTANISTDPATETTLALLLTELQLKADLTETQPVSAASLPLPTGAATSALQTALNALITTLNGTVSTEATLVATNVLLTTIDAVLDTIKIDTGTIDTKLTGASRTAAVNVRTIDGSVAAGAQTVSLWFRGTGGTCDGAAIPTGAILDFVPLKGEDTVGAIAYTVPTGGPQEIIETTLT